MSLEPFLTAALRQGASDLHLEAGMPATLRVRGELMTGGTPVAAETLLAIAKSLLAPDEWDRFTRRRSADLAKTVRGVRCRINILHTARGIGLAVRLLSWHQPTIDHLNLHPDLAALAHHRNGLILACGPAGSGKSSTLAALLHEVNTQEARHIITIEQPVEFLLRPRRSLIRQREVGRDTPSFRAGLLDALREDPDVIMVGEMREPATMRLTLDAAETGHLVLTTVHSATVAEALHRVAGAFPAEIRPMVCAQLADSLRAVVCQRLVAADGLAIRVPECEILIATTPARTLIRQGHFHKLETVLETGAQDGQFTRQRYRAWLRQRATFHVPDPTRPDLAAEDPEDTAPAAPLAPEPSRRGARPSPPVTAEDDVIVIQPPTESLSELLDELDE